VTARNGRPPGASVVTEIWSSTLGSHFAACYQSQFTLEVLERFPAVVQPLNLYLIVGRQ